MRFDFMSRGKWKAASALLVVSALAYLLSVHSATSNDLPFPDGRYVTEQHFCAYDEEGIHRLGEIAALNFRRINGSEIYNYYESICTISNVNEVGNFVNFTSRCNAEGEIFESPAQYLKRSNISFESNGKVFTLCQPSFESSLTNEQIEDIQTALIDLGLAPGKSDGKLGPKTRSAMQQFQKEFGIPETSTLDAQTQAAILNEFASLSIKKYSVDTTSKKLERIEPAVGDETVAGFSNQTAALDTDDEQNLVLNDLHAMQTARAYVLRESLTANNEPFLRFVELGVYENYREALRNQEGFADLIQASVPFVGCVGEPVSVVGFYNTGLHTWALLWIDEQDNIVDARLTFGFVPSGGNSNSAWFQMMQQSEETVAQLLRAAMKIQISAFADLFPYKGCVPADKLDPILNENFAASVIYRNSRTRNGLTDKAWRLMHEGMYNTTGISVDADIVLEIVTREVPGFDFLTVHAERANPTNVVLHGWLLQDDKIITTPGIFVDLLAKD